MADEVDNRVVAMHFNNAEFAKKIETTLVSLDKLQKSLDFANGKKGFEDVQAAANNMNLDKIASGVDNISGKFTAMGAAAFATITNITNRFIDMGINFAKGFTFAPVQQGFQEMETKIGSIQTILANTARHGTGLQEVTDNLNELNKYSDRTIYNFGEMTKNIGLFTNAGIKVEDATSMIKGFSNAAAASGTTAANAAGAAYQLSQGLSNGKIALMDWKSLTNVGMGNQNMKDGLLEIAKAMGTLEETETEAEEVQAHFNETLEKGWLNTDVMSTYLKFMSGDMSDAELRAKGLSATMVASLRKQQETAFDAATKVRTFTQLVGTVKESVGSGWAQTFEILTGGFEKGTELFTDINNAVGKFVEHMTDARNSLLQTWSDFGARQTLIDSFKNIFAAIGQIVNGIRYAFQNLFPPATASDLIKMTASFSDFSIAFRDFINKNLPKFVYGFGVVFSVIRIAVNIVKGVTGLFSDLFKALVPDRAGSNAIGLFGNLARALYTLNVAVINNGVTGFFKGLSKLLVPIAKIIGTVTGKILDFFFSFEYSNLLEGVLDLFKKLGDAVTPFIEKLDFSGKLDSALQFFEKVRDLVSAFIYTLTTGMTEDEGTPIERVALRIREGFETVVEVSKRVYQSILDLRDAFSQVADAVKGFSFGDIFEKDSEKVDILKTKLVSFSKDIGAKDLDGPALDFELGGGGDWEDTADNATGFFEKIGNALSNFFNNVKSFAAGIGTILSGLKTGLDKFFTGDGVVDPNKTGFEVLVDVVKKILFLGLLYQLQRFMREFAGLVSSAKGIFDDLGNVLKRFSGNTESITSKLIKIAIAMGLLALSLKILADIPREDLLGAFVAMTAGFGIMFGMMKAMDKQIKGSFKIKGLAGAMVSMATATLILAAALKVIASVPSEDLWRGLAGLAAAMTLLTAAITVIGANAKGAAGAGAAMIGMSVALLILSTAVLAFGNIPMDVLIQGLASVGAVLAGLTIAVNLMPADRMMAAGLAMIPLAIGMTMMAGAVLAFGSMDLETLIRGIGAVAITLGLIAGALRAMPEAGVSVASAAALILVGVALNIVVKAVETLGAMNFEALKNGIAGIVVLLAAMVIALALMKTALPGAAALLVASVALVVMAEAIERVGSLDFKTIAVGIGTLVVAVLLLAAAGAFLSPFIAALGAAFILLGAGLTLIGVGAYLGARAFVYFSDNVGEGTAKILNTLYLLAEEIPKIFVTFIKNVADSADDIAKQAGRMIKALANIVISALDAIDSTIPRAIETVGKIVSAILDFIGNRLVDFVEMGFKIIKALAVGLMDNIGELTILGAEILLRFIEAVILKLPDLINAGVRLILALINGLGSRMREIVDRGGDLIIYLMAGIASKTLDVIAAAGAILIAFLDGLAKWIDENAQKIHDSGANLARAIVEGLVVGLVGRENMDRVIEAIKKLAGLLPEWARKVLGVESPSKVFKEIGGQVGAGFALGLDRDNLAKNSAVRHAERIVSAFAETLSNLPSAVADMDEFNPVITPVLDLSRVSADAKGLGTMLATPTISPNVSTAQANLISTTGSQNESESEEIPYSGPREVTFIQNNNSPKALSTNDVYRGTKSQIALAKKELGIDEGN